MRARPTLAVVLLVAAALPLPVSLAGHAADTFTASGHIQLGHPLGQFASSAAERAWRTTGDPFLDGTDGVLVQLPVWAPGHDVTVAGASSSDYDLDVYFYDSNRASVGRGSLGAGGACATAAADESCRVPDGARYAYVTLWSGRDVAFTLTVTSVGTEPVAPFLMPTWYTWDTLDLRIVVLPPVNGPVATRGPGVLPDGAGLLLDSPYLQASLDAIAAWERAVAAYVATYPAASHLSGLRLDVKVVGRDATLDDLEDAHIRIAYGPTGAAVLGVAVASETSDGRFVRCDLVDFTWYVYSFTVNDLYNVHAHEFGHCLGLNHPQAPNTDGLYAFYRYPIGDPATPRVCLSSLNVRGLDGAYAWMKSGTTWTRPPREVALDVDDYVVYPAVGSTASCPNAR